MNSQKCYEILQDLLDTVEVADEVLTKINEAVGKLRHIFPGLNADRMDRLQQALRLGDVLQACVELEDLVSDAALESMVGGAS